ncbi:ZrgA family zinc uptake protein [Marinobacter sp. DUT-1]|uniref:ZrgA family zinc uptake protein n=1 Tax=Marinobacter sp. DUT-1 TaxID=3412037 RepID=UPI003D16B787
MKRPGYRLLLLPLTLLAAAATSGENPGAHQHGHAELSFAVDGSKVEVMFASPAYNVVGFEHEVRTEAQSQALNEANDWFAGTPLINTPDGTCSVISSDVHHSGQEQEHEGREDDHGDHGGGHSAFEVIQTLECPGVQDASTLTTPLTTRFERLEHLQAQWAGATSQGATRLEHGERTIELRQ